MQFLQLLLCAAYGRGMSWWRHTWWRVLAILGWSIAAAFAVTSAIQSIQLADTHLRIEWGNAAEWSASVFGGLAAVAGFGALFYAAREWSAGQAERRDNDADQARLIMVEPADQGINAQPVWQFPADDDVVIHNRSDAPVCPVSTASSRTRSVPVSTTDRSPRRRAVSAMT